MLTLTYTSTQVPQPVRRGRRGGTWVYLPGPAPWSETAVRYRENIAYLSRMADLAACSTHVEGELVNVDRTPCVMTGTFTWNEEFFAVVIWEGKTYFAAWDLVVLPGAEPTATRTRSQRHRA